MQIPSSLKILSSGSAVVEFHFGARAVIEVITVNFEILLESTDVDLEP